MTASPGRRKPATTRCRHTTIATALAVSRRHDLEQVAEGIMLCRCGQWFPTPTHFNSHRADRLAAELAAYKTRRPTVDRALLEQVSQVYLAAAPGSRSAAVGDLLGVSPHSAGTYISRARKLGILTAETCRRGVLH